MVDSVLVIRGAFAPSNQLARLKPDVPQARFQFCDLLTNSAAGVAEYISQIEATLSEPTVVVGVSLGGVIGLGLRSRHVRGVLALDPTLRTLDCTPLLAAFRNRLAEAPGFLWSVFGLAQDRSEPRDYTALALGQTAPVRLLAGETAFAGGLPSLIGDETLEMISANPQISAHRLAGVGHDIGLGQSAAIRNALQELLVLDLHKNEEDRAVGTDQTRR